LEKFAFLSIVSDSWIPIRQASILPAAFFRFYLTIDTLAVLLMVFPVGPIGKFPYFAPYRAHKKKSLDKS
jgi:hypothetical protein